MNKFRKFLLLPKHVEPLWKYITSTLRTKKKDEQSHNIRARHEHQTFPENRKTKPSASSGL